MKFHWMMTGNCGYTRSILCREVLSNVFVKQPASKTCITEIMEIIISKKETWRYSIENEIDDMKSKWAHSLRYYVDILHKANIIKIEKRSFGKKKSFGTIVRDVYIFNSTVSEWRVPFRPWLTEKINYTNN